MPLFLAYLNSIPFFHQKWKYKNNFVTLIMFEEKIMIFYNDNFYWTGLILFN